MNNVSTQQHFDLITPDHIDFEPEAISLAQQLSQWSPGEPERWQSYLNTLGYLAFSQWMNELGYLNIQPLTAESPPRHDVMICQVDRFQCCLITVEHVLSETVTIPKFTLHNLSDAPHFYVLIEVIEEQGMAILVGFCRFDTLHNCVYSLPESAQQVPLSLFNADLSHLLFYSRFVDPASIIEPAMKAMSVADSSPEAPSSLAYHWNRVRNNLSQWLEGSIEDGWAAIEDLIHPESLAFSTRSSVGTLSKGKLLNFGLQLSQKTVALIINITPESEDKLKVLVQLHPTIGERYLSSDLKVSLLSQSGKTLQEVQARSHDNYIQLKPFIGEHGKLFSISVGHKDGMFKEDFKL